MSKELTELGQWKVGQKVLVSDYNYHEAIVSITRITDGRGGTIYVDKVIYDIHGHQRGNDVWHKSNISIAVEQDYIRIKGKNARSRLSKVKWLDLTPEKAIEVENVLNNIGIETRHK